MFVGVHIGLDNVRKISCFLLLCLAMHFPYTVSAQLRGSDTTALLQLLDKGDALKDQSPSLALQYFAVALQQSKDAGFTKGVSLASVKMGKWYFGSDNDKSIMFGRQALAWLDKDNNAAIENKAEAHLLLAESYDEKGQIDSSAYFYYLLGAEMEAGNINDPEFAVVVFTKLSIFWINLDKGPELNKEYLETIQRFVEKARSAAAKIKDTADGRTSIYFLKGAYYHALKKFDSARYFYTQYLGEREKIHKLSLARRISTLSNIADTYLQEEQPLKAMRYIDEVKKLGTDTSKVKYLAFFLTFSDFLTAKVLYQQKQYSEAIKLLDKAFTELRKTGSHFRNEMVEAYQIISRSYEGLGNYRKALENEKIYFRLYDSLTQKDKIDMISRLDIRYGIAEKNKELALQKLRISEINSSVQHKNNLLLIAALAAVLILAVFLLWRNKTAIRQKLQAQEINSLHQSIKIESLRASIAGEEKERVRMARELHDGVGGLLSAAKMNLELAKDGVAADDNADYQEGMSLLEEAGTELRHVAHNLMPEILLQEGLAGAVEAFCERMDNKSKTQIKFQSFGTQKHTGHHADLAIYRVIQELLHNIVKHANAETAIVQLNFQQDSSLSITVEDDGIGLEPASSADGIGLKNIQDRVKELGGKIYIESSKGKGTGFYLEFNLENTTYHD